MTALRLTLAATVADLGAAIGQLSAEDATRLGHALTLSIGRDRAREFRSGVETGAEALTPPPPPVVT